MTTGQMPRQPLEAPPDLQGYEGWTLDQETYAQCPDDCGQQSPETDDLAVILTWIDGHKCNGWQDRAGDDD